MLGRTGDVAHSNRLNGFIQGTQNRMREAQIEIATGKRAQVYSQIGSETGILLQAREGVRRADAFVFSNTATADRLRMMDNALGNVVDIAERMRTLLVQRLDPSVGPSLPLGPEIDTMLEQIAAQLNTKLGDRYLFAGSRTDTAPVALPASVNGPADLDAATIYQGDEVRLAARAAERVEVTYGVLASDVFGVMEVLAAAKEAHLANDVDGLQAAMDALTGSFAELADLRGELGSRTARIEAITDTHRANVAYLGETISRIEDADLPSAIASMARDQAAIEAAYITISRLNALSLADYLR
jgi:flagellar hook-associated protein 3 FlgL